MGQQTVRRWTGLKIIRLFTRTIVVIGPAEGPGFVSEHPKLSSYSRCDGDRLTKTGTRDTTLNRLVKVRILVRLPPKAPQDAWFFQVSPPT